MACGAPALVKEGGHEMRCFVQSIQMAVVGSVVGARLEVTVTERTSENREIMREMKCMMMHVSA